MAFNNIIDLDDDSDLEMDIHLNEVAFGTCRVEIVGIRYYKGRVYNREMVSLQREPHNMYDCNAIRVNNIFGVQVGHIKKGQARVLAGIVDRNKARLEGVVPFGGTNKFTIPCNLTLWGDEEDRDYVTNELNRNGLRIANYDCMSSYSSSFYENQENMNYQQRTVKKKVSANDMKKELDQLFDKISEIVKTSPQEAADAIKSSLFPHQKQALSWMIACENNNSLPPFWQEKGPKDYFNSVTNHSASKRPSSLKGGILADDMGLGKTLEIISLIVTNFKNGKSLVTVDKTKPIFVEEKGTIKKKTRRQAKPKLKVEEVVNISDDDDDDESMTPPLPVFNFKEDPEFSIEIEVSTSVEPNHSKRPQRAAKRSACYVFNDDLNDDDLGYEMENVIKSNKISKSTRKSIKQETVVLEPALDVPIAIEEEVVMTSTDAITDEAEEKENSYPTHENYPVHSPADKVGTFQGKKTKAGGPRATLVVCPLSVLGNWQDEISRHVWPGLLDVYTYYGSDRTRDSNDLAQRDIVLTTYQTLTADFNKDCSPLKSTKWLRIVLDEGHCIRNPNTLQAKAIHALEAERRWVVTGTPIQNSLQDLWSIIRFLQLEPFTDRQWWKRVIERPIQNGEHDALVRLQQLMKVIALRRTKNQKINGKPIVDIPEKNVFINYIELSPAERDIYKAVSEHGKVTISKYLKAGTLLKNYTEVLAIITRLRQLCCHPKLCAAALEAAAKEALENSTPEELRKRLTAILVMVITSGVDEECPICLDSLDLPVITHCAHIFCKKCIENVIRVTSASCPMCRGEISLDKLIDAPSDKQEEEIDTTEWTSSAKVDALLHALEKQREIDPTIKCLVVSQFTSFLRLLRQPLEGRGFKFVCLDGSLSQEKRAAAMREFADCRQGSPTIFLLSLKAGGVGLNLTAASRLFLMDPAWNPAAEEQCFDRCHRLGQTKAVEIHKFIVKESVEERMLDLQEQKRRLMTGAFAKLKADEKRQQKINDVTNLFK